MKKTRTPSLLEVAPRNTSFCLCQLQYLVGAKFDLFNALMRSCLAEWSLLVPHKGKELGNICFSKMTYYFHVHPCSQDSKEYKKQNAPYPTLPLASSCAFPEEVWEKPSWVYAICFICQYFKRIKTRFTPFSHWRHPNMGSV